MKMTYRHLQRTALLPGLFSFGLLWCGFPHQGMAADPIPLTESSLRTDISVHVPDVDADVESADVAMNSHEVMTLEDLESYALANNPSLRQAEAIVSIAQGNRTQVGLYPNPVVGYLASQMGDRGTAGQQGGYLEQDIITAGKLKLNRAVAAQDLNQALWLRDLQQYLVMNAVRLRYYEMLAAQRTIEITNNLQTTAEKAAEASRQLKDAGEGTLPDVLQAEIEVDQTAILVNNAQNQYRATWNKLTSVLGVPSLEPSPLAGNLDDPAPVYEWDSTLDWLYEQSPEVQLAQYSVIRAQFAIQRARVEPIPNVNVQASVQRDNGNKENIANLQVTVPIPVFNKNQGAIAAAYGELRRACQETERVKLSLRERLAAAFQRYQNAQKQVSVYENRMLPRSRQTLELVTEGYRKGEFTFLQVLFAQRTYFQTNLSYVQSLTELWRSSVDISGLLLTQEASTESVPTAGSPRTP